MTNLPDFCGLAPSRASALLAFKVGWLCGGGGPAGDINKVQTHDRHPLIADS